MDDLSALLRAAGLPDHARDASPHQVIQQELLPQVQYLAARERVLAERVTALESQLEKQRITIRHQMIEEIESLTRYAAWDEGERRGRPVEEPFVTAAEMRSVLDRIVPAEQPMRRKTDKPTEKELSLMAENNRRGVRIVELERAVSALLAEKQASERENREKCLELAEMAGARDGAARELLFLAGVEGIGSLSRGGKGCIFRALEHLRPDIATLWAEEEDPFALLHRFFPEDRD